MLCFDAVSVPPVVCAVDLWFVEQVGPVDSSLAQFAGVVQLGRLETVGVVVAAADASEGIEFVASQLPSVVVASAMYLDSFASDAVFD